MKALIALDDGADPASAVLDHEFIAAHTNGFDAFATDLRAAEWPPIEAACGLSRDELESVAEAYAKSNATSSATAWASRSTARVRPTCSRSPTYYYYAATSENPAPASAHCGGHSNVQGDRTVGITEKPTAAMLDGIERVFGFKPPRVHGHDAIAAMQAIIDGRSKALVCLGGNLAVALPDPAQCHRAMGTLDLAVHIGTKLNRSHLLVGKQSFIFPCLGRTEQDMQATGPQSITVEDSMSMVHASSGKLRPASEQLRSDRQFSPAWPMPLCQTAKFLGWT